MKIAIISQSSPFTSSADHTITTYADKLSTYSLAEELASATHDLILINVEDAFADAHRLDFKGVELLYWLRLKFGVKTPVITYGFLSLQEVVNISGDSRHFVLHAPGTAHLTIPFDLQAVIDKKDSMDCIASKSSKEYLQPYLKAAHSPESIQHMLKNLEGIRKLHWMLTRVIDIDVPGGEFQHQQNLDFFIDEQLASAPESLEKLNESTITSLRNTIKQIQKKAQSILYIDDQAADGWELLFTHLLYPNGQHKGNLRVLSEGSEFLHWLQEGAKPLEKEDILVNGQLPKLVLLDLRLTAADQNLPSTEVEQFSGARILKKFRKSFPGIPVLITTASNKVWSYQHISKLGADGYWTKFSGATEQDNESYLIAFGHFLETVNCLLGDPFVAEFSKFADKVHQLTSKGEAFWWEHKKWRDAPKQIKVWDKRCEIHHITKVDRHQVMNVLQDTVALYRQYIHQERLKIGYHPFDHQPWTYPSLIVQHLGKIVEIIHHTGSEERKHPEQKRLYIPASKYFAARKDERAKKIMKHRNTASHYSQSLIENENWLPQCCSQIIEYVESS